MTNPRTVEQVMVGVLLVGAALAVLVELVIERWPRVPTACQRCGAPAVAEVVFCCACGARIGTA
jgi:hypothetical protein